MSAIQEVRHDLGLAAPVGGLNIPSDISSPPGPFMPPESAVFVEPEIPYTNPSSENMAGFSTEQTVGRVISRLAYVRQVRQVERNGEEDGRMIDLEVSMVEGFIIPTFFVQVKSSKWGIAGFFDEVGKRMRDEAKKSGKTLPILSGDAEYKRKKEWLAKRRLIVINGGTRDDRPVTDEYIADKFDREMKSIALSESVRSNR